jgi:tRNA U55 pseudouridine synthase TruB
VAAVDAFAQGAGRTLGDLSVLGHGGERASDLARKGLEIQRESGRFVAIQGLKGKK